MIERRTEQEFLKDVYAHEMHVLFDNGINRHIMFKEPGTMNHHFSLITWPGYLCYTGDMGTYVFRRLEDMFEFFRTDREHMYLKSGQTLAINPGYWGEKLEAVDKCDGYKEFSEDLFEAAVIGDLKYWLRDHLHQTTKEERRDLWDGVMSVVLGADGDGNGYRKTAAAFDFNHYVNKDIGNFYFMDFFEHTIHDYSYRFIWCCYALAWGIQQYDESKTTIVEAA